MLFSLSVNGNNREVKCYLESDNWIVQNLNNALETWNSKLSEIWQLLTQSPETFKGGDIWSVMLTIHDALKGIGYGLLVLFFAISVVKTCSSYLDVKKPEHAVKLFIRFALAKGAVGYGLELMMALFSVIQGMVSTIMQNSGFGGDSDVIELPAEMVEKIESVGLLDSIPLWIVTLLGSLFITVLSFIMILTVYASQYGISEYVPSIQAIMMQESGGRGTDPMQASECPYNTRYAKMFDLDEKSGIELTESKPKITDNYAIPSAIGQGTNNFSTVQLGRYVTTLANEGTSFQLSLIDKIDGVETSPKVESQIEINKRSWEGVHAGMELYTQSTGIFDGFPISVAGKSGTAQEVKNRPDHGLFIGYAPADDPEIAVAVRIVNGYEAGNAVECGKNIFEYYFGIE